MTTLYITLGGVLVTLAMGGLATWLAYRDGVARGRGESAASLAKAKAERDQAIAARDAANRIAQAAVDGPRDIDDALKRLDGGSA